MALQAPLAPIRPLYEEITQELTQPLWDEYSCSCVAFVRDNSDIDFPRIRTSDDLFPNHTPCIGCIVLLTFNGYPHIGITADIRPGGIFMQHRFQKGNECITENFRWIPWDFEGLRGFYLDN